MSTCNVNGLAHESDAGLETWGQLLDALEQGDGPSRTVVAAVRFAGVDQPTFREPEVLALDLHLAEPIDVELYTRGDLVTAARETAIGSLDSLAESARQTADAFRLHDLPRAHQGLAEFVSTFQLLTSLTAAVGSADPSSAPSGPDEAGAELLSRMNVSLGALIDFDVNEDWISVADVLEYEVADLLPQWGAVMRVADDRQPRATEAALGSVS